MNEMKRNEITQPGGISKVKHYGWEIKDKPGDLQWIDKTLLYVDHNYQRDPKSKRVLAIASKWSWIACGAIRVAQRAGEDRYYVIDAQHRVLAALKRDDIQELPCIVFKTDSAQQEAGGFYDANTMRRMPTSIEKWRAQLLRGDPTTTFVDSLIKQAGRSASNSTGPKDVRCLTALLRAADSDRGRLQRVWPLITEICDGQKMHERIVEGLLWLEGHLPDGQSLTDRIWRQRLIRLGAAGLLEAAQRAATFYARGGAKVWALGIVEGLNKGCRIHMTVREED